MAVALNIDEDDDGVDEVHDINVTPFIDVILVLLIIFMVAAPLSTVDVPVDLPSATAVPQKRPDKPTYLTLKSDLSLALGESPVRRAEVVSLLDGQGEKHRRLFLRTDRAVPYGEMMDLLDLLRLGGYEKIALVAREGPPKGGPTP